MASVVIRKAWFGRPGPGPGAGTVVKVPPSGVGPPQVAEQAWLDSLAPWLSPGTRTTQAAGAVLAGNVVSSVPAAGGNSSPGAKIAYLVSV